MATKRMFSKEIVSSDAFLDMPTSSQLLYFHLGMEADDDGFIGNPKKVSRFIGASDDDLKILLSKKFLLIFDSGVVVVKHHRMNNNWDKYNCKRTVYLEEFSQLQIKENKAYTLDRKQGNNVQSENSLKTVYRIEEIRRDKKRIEEIRRPEQSSEKKTMKKNSFNYSESNSSDSYEDIIDSDTGQKIGIPKTNANKVFWELLAWAEKRRGFKFLNVKKQFKAFSIAKTSNITPNELMNRWSEFEKDKFWKEKGFDFFDVVNNFSKKR